MGKHRLDLQRQPTKRRSELPHLNLDLRRLRVELPFDLEFRYAGAPEPLVEEPVESPARHLFHDRGKVVRGGVPVAEPLVVGPHALPERAVADLAAQHVQHPRRLLVDVRTEQAPRIGHGVRHDDRVRRLVEVPEDPLPRRVHLAHEAPAAVRPIQVAGGEVGREALAEPDVRPVALGHRVAEPLMSDLVGDQGLDPVLAVDRVLVVEHVAGVLQAAPAGRRLHVEELGVGIVAQPTLERAHDAGGGSERPQADIAVLRVNPGLDRHAIDHCLAVANEPRDADRHHLRGHRRPAAPLGPAQPVLEIDGFHERPGRHDLVVRRRRDDEGHACLVRRVIDHRQPVVGPIRPVVGEEGPLAVPVRADREAVGGDTPVADLDAAAFTGRRPAVQNHEEPVVLLPEPEGPAGERYRGNDHAPSRPASAGLPADLHGAPLRRIIEIELDLGDWPQDPEGDQRPAVDLVALVREREFETVVQNVDRRSGQLRLDGRRQSRGEKESPRRTHRDVPRSARRCRGHARTSVPGNGRRFAAPSPSRIRRSAATAVSLSPR